MSDVGVPRAKARGPSTCSRKAEPPKHTLLRSFRASKGTLSAFHPLGSDDDREVFCVGQGKNQQIKLLYSKGGKNHEKDRDSRHGLSQMQPARGASQRSGQGVGN